MEYGAGLITCVVSANYAMIPYCVALTKRERHLCASVARWVEDVLALLFPD